MRLAVVDNQHSRPAKAFLGMIRRMSKAEPPDVVKTLLYRPNMFGRWMNPAFQDVMRGPSPWTVGERELFAAFTSKLNQCVF